MGRSVLEKNMFRGPNCPMRVCLMVRRGPGVVEEPWNESNSPVDFSARVRWISVIVMTGVGKVWMAAADVP